MHILLIKMSSMGDIIHTLPALTDAALTIPHIQFDWVVEPAFADIPRWHPAVNTVIPLPLRQWRKDFLSHWQKGDIKHFISTVREKKYDLIIDAQGLLKSAIITAIARGDTHGLNHKSAREWMSSFFYGTHHHVAKNQHAIMRTRELFAKALHYPIPTSSIDYHIDPDRLPILAFALPHRYVVFLHGTTWETKHYPEHYWEQLIEKADHDAIPVYLPWGNETEKLRAERLAKKSKHAVVLPKLSINEIARVLKNATAVVSVDTGLGHLSNALETPTIGLYGPTDPVRVGMIGSNETTLQAHFPCAPCHSKTCHYAKTHTTEITPACYATIPPDKVWALLKTKIITES